MNDAVKLKRLDNQAAREAAQMRILEGLLKSPVNQLIMALVMADWLHKQNLIGNLAKTTIDTGAVGVTLLEAAAPILPYAIVGGSQLMNKLIPADGLAGLAGTGAGALQGLAPLLLA